MDDKTPAWKRYLLTLLPWLLFAAATAVASWLGLQPPPPPIIVEVEREAPAPPVVIGDGVEWSPTFGWVEDPDVIAENRDPARTLQFGDTPAGKVVMGDEDVFLWPAVRNVNNRGPPWYPNVNQGPVGCCVGAGTKHGVDVCQASQILAGKRATWKPVSVEVIYGGSRVEVGGGRIRGDGSIGRWAMEWVKDYGVAAMGRYDSHDLTEFSPARAREFGRRGVPDDIEKAARDHPVKGAALVTSWADAKRAIGQGYPVVVCSNQGFTMARDRDGFCRPQGTWPHCMVIIGTRSDREGGFILNSWGDRAHTGPVWPPDAPVAGFWADARTIDRMLRQGDSFALSDMQGFPARKLPDWFLSVPRVRDPFRPFAREVALAW